MKKNKLQFARLDAEKYLLSVLRGLNKRPSLVEAAKLVNSDELGVDALGIALALRMRTAAMEFDANVQRLQYRSFFVGGMGIGLVPFSGWRYSWFVRGAWNTKPTQKSCKFCAEMRIMRAAREHTCAHLLRVFTSGMPREEDVLVVGGDPEKALLRVCEACRELIRGKYSDLFIPESQFISARPDCAVCSIHSVEELRKHNGDNC